MELGGKIWLPMGSTALALPNPPLSALPVFKQPRDEAAEAAFRGNDEFLGPCNLRYVQGPRVGHRHVSRHQVALRRREKGKEGEGKGDERTAVEAS